jgi:cytochrome c
MISLAVLSSVLTVYGALPELANFVYSQEELSERAYPIAGVDLDSHGQDHGSEEAPEELSVAALLATATTADGAKVFRKCTQCHTVEQGGKDNPGPNIWNLIGGPFAQSPGFNYSKAFKNAADVGQVWNFDNLSAYLENPREFLPGNKMSFAGLRKPKDRAAVLVFLRSKSDAPIALPEPPAPAVSEPTAGEDAAPADAHN